MGDEIRDQYNEIKSFLEKEGFNIFYEVLKSRKTFLIGILNMIGKIFLRLQKKKMLKQSLYLH